MKHTAFISLILLLFSCSNHTYEKEIADYMQKNNKNPELNFQVLSIQEYSPVTVKDSIEILKKSFEEDKAFSIEMAKDNIKTLQERLDVERKKTNKSQPMIEHYEKNLSDNQEYLENIKNFFFKNPYENIDANKILVIPVECTFSYWHMKLRKDLQTTAVFYFTPDKKKILYYNPIENNL